MAHRSERRGRSPLLMIAVCSLGGMWYPPAFTGDFESVRATCARAARATQEINLSSGVYTERAVANAPLRLEVPIGIDGQSYEACIQREGFAPGERAAATFTRLDECNTNEVRGTRINVGPAGTPSISGRFDREAYARCVSSDIAVDVEIPDERL